MNFEVGTNEYQLVLVGTNCYQLLKFENFFFLNLKLFITVLLDTEKYF